MMRMKSILLAITFSLVLFGGTGCLKGTNPQTCTDRTPQSEEAEILAYAAAQGFSVSPHPSGLYYQVLMPGSGAIPLPTSHVYIRYVGKLVSSNAVFDQQTNSDNTGWQLQTLIPGWQIGLPLIAEGGKIRLIIPSSLAYGCRGFAAIPANAVLFFEIELVDVQ